MARRRILIVDDDDDVREVAVLALETVGEYEVLSASSGREALELAATQQPDAILLDVMMPDLDGPATFQRLQEDPATREIPVILLTAKVQLADRQRFADLGVQGVLSKPFDPLALAGEVSGALGWDP